MFFLAASEIKGNLYVMPKNVNTSSVHLTTEHLTRPISVKNLLKQASYAAWKSQMLLEQKTHVIYRELKVLCTVRLQAVH